MQIGSPKIEYQSAQIQMDLENHSKMEISAPQENKECIHPFP